MGKIVLLDDLTINQIAAGEVIERPASAIKEMVENSIDAGAKNIIVEIKNGGRTLIRITDDGSGISEDDMEIAFERHATSKIRSADDLQTVSTMGFRGEALASIASIAKVEMISKTENDEIGHRILIEGGKLLDKSEIAAQKGTRITVQNLFYNTPVRYKFLGKDYTEAGHIETIVTRIALINRDVAIKLISNDKVLIQTNGNGKSKDIIYSIYGKDVADGIIDVDYTYEDMRVTGVVGKPEIARSNRTNQMFFVNGRYVRDKNLTAAAEQAYKDVIPSGKYGFLILNLEMDPQKVDVNVHPAKLEVRFAEENSVFKIVYHAIKSKVSEKAFPPDFTNNINKGVNYANIKGNTSNDIINKTSKKIDDRINSRINSKSDSTKFNSTNDMIDSFEFGEPVYDSNKSAKFLSGFLKKFIKEPDETQEEIENNKLLEIYNARNVTNLKPLSKPIEVLASQVANQNKSTIDDASKSNVSEGEIFAKVQQNDNASQGESANNSSKLEQNDSVSQGENTNSSSKLEENDSASQDESTNNSSNQEESSKTKQSESIDNLSEQVENKISNEEIVDKTVKLGSVSISSNTKQLDFNINKIMKEQTQEIDTTKKIEIQETQVIPVTKPQPVLQETQKLDLKSDLKNLAGVKKDNSLEKSIEENTEKYIEKNAEDIAKSTGKNIEEDIEKTVEKNTILNEEISTEINSETNIQNNISTKNEYSETNEYREENEYINLENENRDIENRNTEANKSATLINAQVEINKDVDSINTQAEINKGTDLVNEETEANKDSHLISAEVKENKNLEVDKITKSEEENLKQDKNNLENAVPSLEAVEDITAKILELKMNNLDSTQMIDTSRVRDAMKEQEPITPEFANMYRKAFGTEANEIRKERELEARERAKQSEKINISNEFLNAENDTLFTDSGAMPERVNYKLIGVVFDSNIIIELNNEMYIIDQNAAAERIIYEIVRNNYYNDNEKDSQSLLLPDIVTVSFREMSLARENIELFEKAGFSFEEFGENTIKLTAVPSICEDLNTKRLFIEILNEIDRALISDKRKKEEIFISAVASKSTTKIKRRLDEKEIDELLQKLLTLPEPFDCKHGTTTAVKISRTDIEKKFSRRK